MTKKEATFYMPGKGFERVDDDGIEYCHNLLLDEAEFWFTLSEDTPIKFCVVKENES